MKIKLKNGKHTGKHCETALKPSEERGFFSLQYHTLASQWYYKHSAIYSFLIAPLRHLVQEGTWSCSLWSYFDISLCLYYKASFAFTSLLPSQNSKSLNAKWAEQHSNRLKMCWLIPDTQSALEEYVVIKMNFMNVLEMQTNLPIHVPLLECVCISGSLINIMTQVYTFQKIWLFINFMWT